MANDDLWVVVPVYNEADAIGGVIEEWIPVLEQCGVGYTVCLIDDGSTDGTPGVIRELARRHGRIEVITKANTGHGRTCLHGYRIAAERGARWVLQIDSDGQCDPSYFPAFWRLREEYPVVFGFRRTRQDEWWRRQDSRLTALGVFTATGIWVRDPNVPYRLMRTAAISNVIANIAEDIDMVNIYAAAALQAQFGIRWIEIGFRRRAAGISHHYWRLMVRRGLSILRQLARDRDRVSGRGARGGAGP
jgi:dolichol-phosphate mannosyltransferase